jgi:DNA-binding transcriptional LysR family regulator
LMEVTQQPGTQISGRVRLSAPVTLGARRLVQIVSSLTERHPELQVELSLNDRNTDLVREGFDLAVRIGELAPSGLIARRVGTYRLVCCAAPAFLARHGMPTDPAQASGYSCVINANLQPRDRWPFRSPNGQSIIVPVSGRLELDNDEAQRSAALSGAGIAYVPHHLVDDDILAGRLIEVFADWEKLELPVQIVLPSRRLVPRRVTALVEAIVVGLRSSEIADPR